MTAEKLLRIRFVEILGKIRKSKLNVNELFKSILVDVLMKVINDFLRRAFEDDFNRIIANI